MIDKGLYRKNFRGGGMDMGNASNQAQSAAMGGGGGGNNNNQGRDYGALGTLSDPREKQDFVTQKYSGDGFFSGYRNLDSRGQPKMGLAYLGDRIGNFAKQLNPISILGGIIAGPFGSVLGQGLNKLTALKDYNNLADYARGEFGLFQDEDEDEIDTIDIRDKFNGSGIMNPNLITPTNLNDYLGYRNREYIESTPSSNPQEYDFLSNAMAEVTQKDIDASKARGFKMLDRDTAVTLGLISPNVTDYEFEQLKQGNITEPGTYVG